MPAPYFFGFFKYSSTINFKKLLTDLPCLAASISILNFNSGGIRNVIVCVPSFIATLITSKIL